MARSNLRFLAAIAPLFLIGPGASLAAPPTGTSGTTPSSDRTSGSGRDPRSAEFQAIGVGRPQTSFAGTVLDVNERPIANVQVKLFIDGQLAGTAITEATGYYDLRTVFDPNDDVTALLWFAAPERALMAKELVIRESKASQEHGLISKCVPRATHTPGRQFRVYMFDPANRNKELAEADCLP